jgi:LuxR family transcriptional regulator, maltose regulon positive regulatory protein
MDACAELLALIGHTLGDVDLDRRALRAAFDAAQVQGDAQRCTVLGAALLLCIATEGGHYAGFEEAVGALRLHRHARPSIHDPALRLVADAGDLAAGAFDELDNPALLPLAEDVVRGLANEAIPTAMRLIAAMGAASYFDARVDIEKVWWLELAVRDVLARPDAPPRLAAEWHRSLVVACYSCGQVARGEELRRRQAAQGTPPIPVVELKLLLLDAYTLLGEGRAEAGREVLARAEPLLRASRPCEANLWHFLASRLAMLEQRLGDALKHARLANRLREEAAYPDRWAGLDIMQEGQVQVARGEYFEAVPFFEHAHRTGTGIQAEYCTCLANFARALGQAERGDPAQAHQSLVAAFAFARERDWTGFFRVIPKVAARLCAWALEAGVEAEFARRVIAERRLEAEGIEVVAWPWPIRVRTLGRFELQIDGKALSMRGKVARKPIELLQFIIASGGSDVASSNAMFALWPDLEGDKARSACNVAVHRLRKLLGRDEAITLELGRLGLDTQVMWVDCLAFEALADRVLPPLTPATAGAAQRAQALYAGHFLHDDEDHAWLMVHRSRLASKFKRLVRSLADHATLSGDALAARTLLERAIELDPLAEDLARLLMQHLAMRGEAAAALLVFQRCAAALKGLLGAAPSAATRELAARLRQPSAPPPKLGGDR